MDNDGTLYITGGGEGNVYVIDGDGTLLFTLTAENGWINSLVKLSDGTVAAMYYEEGENGYLLSTIDKTAKAFGEDISIPYNVYNLINGGEYDYYYNDGYSLYGYQVATETATQLINWINSDINVNDLQNIIPLDDGRILGISSNWRNRPLRL